MYRHTLVKYSLKYKGSRLYSYMGECGQVDRVFDSRSQGSGFDSHCWSCVEVSGKLLIPYCLRPCNIDRYLVERKIVKKNVNGISCRKCADFSPEEMRPYKREFQYQGCNLWSLLNWTHWDIRLQTYPLFIHLQRLSTTVTFAHG